MDSLEDLKRKRFQFLHKLWELTRGNEKILVKIRQVATPLGYDENVAEPIVQYLAGENLLEVTTYGFYVSNYLDAGLYIKHGGVVEVEEALSKPESPTVHFPANVTNYINIGSMVNSNISQASPNSNVINETGKQDLKEIVIALKTVLKQAPSGPDREELASEIQTIESQIGSPRPKPVIIRESLASAKRILESMGGPAGSLAKISSWLVDG